MRLLIWIPVALVLAGCAADGSYTGFDRAFDGSFSTITVDVQGHSSAYKRAEELHLGYLGEGQEQYSTYSFSPDSGINATGLAAEITACDANPECITAALN